MAFSCSKFTFRTVRTWKLEGVFVSPITFSYVTMPFFLFDKGSWLTVLTSLLYSLQQIRSKKNYSLSLSLCIYIYMSKNYNKLSVCISNLLERILFQTCVIILEISLLMKYHNFLSFSTIGKLICKKNGHYKLHLKLLSGTKWFNFWSSKVEER